MRLEIAISPLFNNFASIRRKIDLGKIVLKGDVYIAFGRVDFAFGLFQRAYLRSKILHRCLQLRCCNDIDRVKYLRKLIGASANEFAAKVVLSASSMSRFGALPSGVRYAWDR